MECKCCGRDFEVSRKNRKFCSRDCSQLSYVEYQAAYRMKRAEINAVLYPLIPDKELPVIPVLDTTDCISNRLTAENRPNVYLEREKFDDSKFKSMSKLDCLYCKLQKNCHSFMTFYGNTCPAFIKVSRKELQRFL